MDIQCTKVRRESWGRAEAEPNRPYRLLEDNRGGMRPWCPCILRRRTLNLDKDDDGTCRNGRRRRGGIIGKGGKSEAAVRGCQRRFNFVFFSPAAVLFLDESTQDGTR